MRAAEARRGGGSGSALAARDGAAANSDASAASRSAAGPITPDVPSAKSDATTASRSAAAPSSPRARPVEKRAPANSEVARPDEPPSKTDALPASACAAPVRVRSSRTAALALAAQAAADKAAATRAETAAAARQAAEDFQRVLSEGGLSLPGVLMRFAVGASEDQRCYVNHYDFSQTYWDKGHAMDHTDFKHAFGFWAFAERRPGTQRIVIGAAGGRVTNGPMRCLVNQSSEGEAGWYTPDMAQNGFTPHHSFWAFTDKQPGTERIIAFLTTVPVTQSLLLRQQSEGAVACPPGFRQALEFWAYPDTGWQTEVAVPTALKFAGHEGGYISSEGDLYRGRMSIAEAKARCAELPGCRGFTFEGADGDGVKDIWFKNKWNFFHEGGWVSYRLWRSGDFDEADAAAAAAVGRQPNEYDAAKAAICIEPEHLGRCEVLQRAETLNAKWHSTEKQFDEYALRAGRQAFPRNDVGTSGEIYVELLHDDESPRVELLSQLRKLGRPEASEMLQPWRTDLVPAVLRFLAEAAEPGDASAILLLLSYSSWRLFDKDICPVIARRSFDRCLLALRIDNDADDVQDDARTEFRGWLAGYLETHKERALASAFVEPAKLYWRRLYGGGSLAESHVDAHAANVYAALVEKVLGVRCPFSCFVG